jgi:hypothetical protein
MMTRLWVLILALAMPFAALAQTSTASGVTAGTYGSATQVGTFTVDKAGRVTAASNTAITMAGSVSGGYVTRSSTNLLYAPDKSNRVYCYESSTWTQKTIPDAGITVACTGLTNSTLYYLYVYDNAGTLTLDLTTTAPTTQNGIQVKTAATSRTLIATCYANASGAVTTYGEDQSTQLLCNRYNKRHRAIWKAVSPTSHTYATAAWRSANGDTANRVQFVSDGTQHIICQGVVSVSNSGGGQVNYGLGYDTTAGPSNNHLNIEQAGAAVTAPMIVTLNTAPSSGFHYVQLLEYVGGGTTTYYFDSVWLESSF